MHRVVPVQALVLAVRVDHVDSAIRGDDHRLLVHRVGRRNARAHRLLRDSERARVNNWAARRRRCRILPEEVLGGLARLARKSMLLGNKRGKPRTGITLLQVHVEAPTKGAVDGA